MFILFPNTRNMCMRARHLSAPAPLPPAQMAARAAPPGRRAPFYAQRVAGAGAGRAAARRGGAARAEVQRCASSVPKALKKQSLVPYLAVLSCDGNALMTRVRVLDLL